MLTDKAGRGIISERQERRRKENIRNASEERKKVKFFLDETKRKS